MFNKTMLVSLIWALSCGLSQAASISGNLSDEMTNQPLPSEEYPFVSLYKFDSQNNVWNFENMTTPDSSGNFKFSSLPAGYYHIYTTASHYINEYYNNTTKWELKQTLKLSATKDLTLQNIALKPFPLFINSINQSTTWLPSNGGNVDITLEVMNNTGMNKDIQFWVTSYNTKDMDKNIAAYSPITKNPIKATLTAGMNTITLPLTIPAHYADGELQLYINAGKNHGNPTLPITTTALIKGSEFVYPKPYHSSSAAKSQEKEIPLRLSTDGKVLIKGIQP